MNFELPPIESLKTESDVEQKLVFPLLTTPTPYGFGISPTAVLTKMNIRRLPIGKGAERKVYFPDYLVVLGGLPLAVVEAKAPGENLDEAFREGRLYAAELNAIFRSGLNPLTVIVATDGQRLVAGHWDQAAPLHELNHADITASSEKMAALQRFMGAEALRVVYEQLSQQIKPQALKKPRRLLGGTGVQHEEIGQNTFGATIAADLGHIFNPSSREDRAYIARHGYIPSRRRERYIDPIDRVIRAARPPSETDSRLIEDTGAPSELIQSLREGRQLEKKVILIVGSVGAGKSTFVDYLQWIFSSRAAGSAACRF